LEQDGVKRHSVEKCSRLRWRTAWLKESRHPRRWRRGARPPLLLDLVDPIAGLVLRGLDVDVVLFAGGGDEAAHAVRLPIRGRPDLGQGRALGVQSAPGSSPLAVGVRRCCLLGMCGLSGLLVGLGLLLRRGCRGLPLAGLWRLGAACFGLAPFFEEAFSGATVAPCGATTAAFSALLGFCVRHDWYPFCARSAHDDGSLSRRKRKAMGAASAMNVEAANDWRWSSFGE